MAITFDASTKRIVLDSSYVDAIEIYSRWKEWVQAGNAGFDQAMRTVGGDPLGGGIFVSQYYFLENGWRVRPMEASHTLVIAGNLGVDGGGDPVVPTLGTFKVLVQYTVPVQAQAIATSGGGSSSSPAQIAAAVRTELTAELAKIAQFVFTQPNKVDANVRSDLLRWNGTDWAEVT